MELMHDNEGFGGQVRTTSTRQEATGMGRTGQRSPYVVQRVDGHVVVDLPRSEQYLHRLRFKCRHDLGPNSSLRVPLQFL